MTLTANVGTIVDQGDGTWRWTAATRQLSSQFVTITATDADGSNKSMVFELVIVEPRTMLAHPFEEQVGLGE